ncbi:MAG: glycosyltransferase [Nostocales cyanobacterium 94392]|nr:glycosyltransferase [Nostocales cyanobacterium 94392]
MKLSVIIPCLNAADTIVAQLEALIQQQCCEPWEIIIADNGSTDQTLEIVKQYQQNLPNLRIVDASAIKGSAYARNVGANAALSENLAFCDADDEVTCSWVAAMIEALSKYDFVAGCSDYSKLNEPWVVNCCGLREANGIKNYVYFPYAAGNNLGVKRLVHNSVGGFDQTMLLLQDIDYCWRIQKTGIKLDSAANAVIHFRFRNTVKGMYRRCWRLGCYDILLHQKHQKMGMPKLIQWRNLSKDAAILPLKFLVKVRDRESFVRWLLDLAWLGGHLQGCIKYNYLAI